MASEKLEIYLIKKITPSANILLLFLQKSD